MPPLALPGSSSGGLDLLSLVRDSLLWIRETYSDGIWVAACITAAGGTDADVAGGEGAEPALRESRSGIQQAFLI